MIPFCETETRATEKKSFKALQSLKFSNIDQCFSLFLRSFAIFQLSVGYVYSSLE